MVRRLDRGAENMFKDERDKFAVLRRVRHDYDSPGGDEKCGATIRKRYALRIEVRSKVDATLSLECNVSRTEETVENR